MDLSKVKFEGEAGEQAREMVLAVQERYQEMSDAGEMAARKVQGIQKVIEEVKTKVESEMTEKEREMLKVSFRAGFKSQIAA
jgi:hypothetical protein